MSLSITATTNTFKSKNLKSSPIMPVFLKQIYKAIIGQINYNSSKQLMKIAEKSDSLECIEAIRTIFVKKIENVNNKIGAHSSSSQTTNRFESTLERSQKNSTSTKNTTSKLKRDINTNSNLKVKTNFSKITDQFKNTSGRLQEKPANSKNTVADLTKFFDSSQTTNRPESPLERSQKNSTSTKNTTSKLKKDINTDSNLKVKTNFSKITDQFKNTTAESQENSMKPKIIERNPQLSQITKGGLFQNHLFKKIAQTTKKREEEYTNNEYTSPLGNFPLNEAQLDSLFTDNNVDPTTLMELSEKAKDNNIECIVVLHQIALRNDDVGKQAENILFDLFSRTTTVGAIRVDETIQSVSLKLYEVVSSVNKKAIENKKKEDTVGKKNQFIKKDEFIKDEFIKKFNSPTKLLYMAGSAMSKLDEQQDYTTIFTAKNITQGKWAANQAADDPNLWSKNRMLMTDEIDAATKMLTKNNNELSLNFPIPLLQPNTNANVLLEQIQQKKSSNNSSNKPHLTEIFPINTGDHWMLFTLYTEGEPDFQPKCVVFSSYGQLREGSNIKNGLINAAKEAGVSEQNIQFIEPDGLQKHVPNGCGIFVIKAVEMIASDPKNPVDMIKKFTENFALKSQQEQELFNIQNRRQIYGYSFRELIKPAGSLNSII